METIQLSIRRSTVDKNVFESAQGVLIQLFLLHVLRTNSVDHESTNSKITAAYQIRRISRDKVIHSSPYFRLTERPDYNPLQTLIINTF